MKNPAVRLCAHPLLRYGMLALCGLSLDIAIFASINALTGWIFWANILSSWSAISFMYVTSLRFVFKEGRGSRQRYALFVGYYAFSIATFSWLIDALVVHAGLAPLAAKLASVPVSFFVNYFFARLILNRV